MKTNKSISTKKGDKGFTSLLDGSRVTKDSIRPETYGTIDEANAFLGLYRAHSTLDKAKHTVIQVQHRLYFINSELACPPDKKHLLKRTLHARDLKKLDETLHEIEQKVQPPPKFVLYGTTAASAYADTARALLRRAERRIQTLHSLEPLTNEHILPYINRLSDLLFLLARWEEQQAQLTPIYAGEV